MFVTLKRSKKSIKEVAREELQEALSKYSQAEQNFRNAEGDFFIEKSIYDLKSAEMYLTHILRKTRSDTYDSHKLINAGAN